MASSQPRPVYTTCGFVIANVVYGDESKTLFLITSIVDKLIRKHQVETYEVEEVLENNPKIRYAEKGEREGEDAYLALGQTDDGRYLAVLFIYKQTQEALIMSARDMATKERKHYGKK